jgi:predicted dehydrogenase
VAYFEGASKEPGTVENRQWLQAVRSGSQPLVRPEQAFVVTQILEGIYRSAADGKEVFF